MSEIDRVEAVRAFFKFNKKTFTDILGNSTSQSYTNFLNGSSKLSLRMIRGLKEYDPRINIDWVLTGQGEMFLNLSSNGNNIQKVNNNDGTVTQLNGNGNKVNSSIGDSSKTELEVLKGENDHLKKENKSLKKEVKLLEQSLTDKERLIQLLEKNQK